MTIKRLSILLLLINLLTACGDSRPLDERFYGTWIDPSGGNEPVVFRDDGTVSWFGKEGTFDTYRYSRTSCGPHGYGFCPFDHGHGLEVSVSGKTHKIRPDFDSYPNAWFLYPKGDTIYQNDSSENGPGSPVVLLRAGTFESPLMSSDFSKLGQGLGIADNAYYEGGCAYFNCNSLPGARVHSANPLLASQRWEWFAYNESANRWESALQSGSPDAIVFGRDSVVVSSEVILQEVFVHLSHYRWKVDHLRASFDKGATWKILPAMDFTYSEGEWEIYPDGLSSAWFTPSTIQLAGSVLIQVVDITPKDDYLGPSEQVSELWTLDAAADSPSWTLRATFRDPGLWNPTPYTHPTTGTIVLHTPYSDVNQNRISHDYGVTWDSFEAPCQPYSLLAHEQGFFCTNHENRELHWYNSTANSWTTHDINFDELLTPGDPTNGAYIRRGAQIIKWQPNGTETLIDTISGALGYGDIYVFDDQIIVNKFGLWRKKF
ncbi:MAG: hypothetical protein VX699_03675 [Myxococcota bacterium]|nr:hypothetical protein [Myxococcota bacterium]